MTAIVDFLPTGTPSKAVGDFDLRISDPNPGGSFSVVPNPQADAFYKWSFNGAPQVGSGLVSVTGLPAGVYRCMGLPAIPLDVVMYPAPKEAPQQSFLRRYLSRLAELLHRR
jgi:hypothetical protein